MTKLAGMPKNNEFEKIDSNELTSSSRKKSSEANRGEKSGDYLYTLSRGNFPDLLEAGVELSRESLTREADIPRETVEELRQLTRVEARLSIPEGRRNYQFHRSPLWDASAKAALEEHLEVPVAGLLFGEREAEVLENAKELQEITGTRIDTERNVSFNLYLCALLQDYRTKTSEVNFEKLPPEDALRLRAGEHKERKVLEYLRGIRDEVIENKLIELEREIRTQSLTKEEKVLEKLLPLDPQEKEARLEETEQKITSALGELFGENQNLEKALPQIGEIDLLNRYQKDLREGRLELVDPQEKIFELQDKLATGEIGIEEFRKALAEMEAGELPLRARALAAVAKTLRDRAIVGTMEDWQRARLFEEADVCEELAGTYDLSETFSHQKGSTQEILPPPPVTEEEESLLETLRANLESQLASRPESNREHSNKAEEAIEQLNLRVAARQLKSIFEEKAKLAQLWEKADSGSLIRKALQEDYRELTREALGVYSVLRKKPSGASLPRRKLLEAVAILKKDEQEELRNALASCRLKEDDILKEVVESREDEEQKELSVLVAEEIEDLIYKRKFTDRSYLSQEKQDELFSLQKRIEELQAQIEGARNPAHPQEVQALFDQSRAAFLLAHSSFEALKRSVAKEKGVVSNKEQTVFSLRVATDLYNQGIRFNREAEELLEDLEAERAREEKESPREEEDERRPYSTRSAARPEVVGTPEKRERRRAFEKQRKEVQEVAAFLLEKISSDKKFSKTVTKEMKDVLGRLSQKRISKDAYFETMTALYENDPEAKVIWEKGREEYRNQKEKKLLERNLNPFLNETLGALDEKLAEGTIDLSAWNEARWAVTLFLRRSKDKEQIEATLGDLLVEQVLSIPQYNLLKAALLS